MIVNEQKLGALLIGLVVLSFFVGIKIGFLIFLTIWGTHVFMRYKGLLPKKSLKGEHVLITGGGRGIGRQLAIQLGSKGCKITIVEMDLDQAEITLNNVKKIGCKDVQIFQCDVTNEEQVNKVFEDAVKTFGEIDILINNAGIVIGDKLTANSFKPMKKVVEVNTIAHFQTILLVLNKMIKRNHGHIVTVSSCAGYLPSPGLADYNASKYGAVGIHEALSMELQGIKSDVQTTLICPWFVKTRMAQDVHETVPFGIQDLNESVQRIVYAIEQNEYIVVIPWAINILIFFKQILPSEVNALLQRFSEKDQKISQDMRKARLERETKEQKKNK